MAKRDKKKQKREAVQLRAQYKTRAKRLRPFFKDMFSAKSGFDLRKPGTWTPQQKRKVTNYFRVMAPRITGDFKVKRYRLPENTRAAIDASLQEHPLKGQTAVAFSMTHPREKLEISIKDGVANVRQSGVSHVELKFNKKAFLKDPDAEIDRALNATDANIFRVITGAQQQLKTLTRSDVKEEIARLTRMYKESNIRRDMGQRPFDDWLNGLMAYPGTEKKTQTAVDKFVYRQERASAKREIDRLDTLSKKHGGKGYKKTIAAQVEITRDRKARRRGE